MINLINREVNDKIIIYVNTLDPDIPYDSNLFLFGFKNGFTNEWSYVCPRIVKQNTRYTQFEISLVIPSQENGDAGDLHLSPDGNYDYKLWAIEEITLDPSFGHLLDEGQAYLESCEESVDITYISDNENDKSIVYLTEYDPFIDQPNVYKDEQIISYVNTLEVPFIQNNLLIGFQNGFTKEWSYVIPEIVIQNTRYTQFNFTIVLPPYGNPTEGVVEISPTGNYDYKVWATATKTLSPIGGYLLDESQIYLEVTKEITNVTYISDNETEKNIVYLTRDCSDCPIWSTDPDYWNMAYGYWNCDVTTCDVWSTQDTAWATDNKSWNC